MTIPFIATSLAFGVGSSFPAFWSDSGASGSQSPCSGSRVSRAWRRPGRWPGRSAEPGSRRGLSEASIRHHEQIIRASGRVLDRRFHPERKAVARNTIVRQSQEIKEFEAVIASCRNADDHPGGDRRSGDGDGRGGRGRAADHRGSDD